MCGGGNDGGGVDLSICLFQPLFFFFFKDKNKKFSTQYAIQKSHTAQIKTSVNNPTVGPSVSPQNPLHPTVGEKGVLFQRAMEEKPNCSEASPAASSQILHKAPSSPASCRGGELAGLFCAWIIRQGPAPRAHLKDTQPTELLQN